MVQPTAIDVEAEIRRILAEHTRLGDQAAGIDRTANLFEAGLDSVAAVGVMLAIEEAFNLEFPQTGLVRATFSTIRALADVIQKTRGTC